MMPSLGSIDNGGPIMYNVCELWGIYIANAQARAIRDDTFDLASLPLTVYVKCICYLRLLMYVATLESRTNLNISNPPSRTYKVLRYTSTLAPSLSTVKPRSSLDLVIV
jgi:hypothetical protein